MKKILLTIFLIVFCFDAAGFPKSGGDSLVDYPASINQDIAEQVKKAFGEVRNGSYSSANDLLKYGEKLFPYLKPYLKDENDNVKREVVKIVLEIGGDKSLPIIAEALDSSSPDVQRSTADSLYLRYSLAIKYLPLGDFSKYKTFLPENITAQTAIGEALRKNIKAGNIGLKGIFLLANFPGKETEDVLNGVVKTPPTSTSETISLAAQIVLARLNSKEAVRELSKIIGDGGYESLKFLLDNIFEIDSKEILSLLSKTLDNRTFISKGREDGRIHEKTAAGLWVEYPVSRRLCDLAVNSFVERFKLKVSFRLHSTVYLDKQISEVRQGFRSLEKQ